MATDRTFSQRKPHSIYGFGFFDRSEAHYPNKHNATITELDARYATPTHTGKPEVQVSLNIAYTYEKRTVTQYGSLRLTPADAEQLARVIAPRFVALEALLYDVEALLSDHDNRLGPDPARLRDAVARAKEETRHAK